MTRVKGNAVIGQSGGPTSVINQSLVGAVQEALRQDAIDGIYGARHGLRGILDEDFLDLSKTSAADLERVAETPSAALGSVRLKPGKEECEALLKIFQKYDVRYFFYIGGNDSAETAHLVEGLAKDAGYELKLAHIPKTIDNDLRVTDHCPGFGSAARFVTLAHVGDNLDNAALKGVKINVIMGRHAGFLTAASVLARLRPGDGPHLIYVPEVAFDTHDFCRRVDDLMTRYERCVVAVSEGIADSNGDPIFTTGERDSHGNVQLSGTGALGDFLAGTLKKELDLKRVRADTFGYLQRSFPTVVSATDAREAREVGTYAVKVLNEGDVQSGSVAIRRREGTAYESEYFVTELANVARKTRSLDGEFLVSGEPDISDRFIDYVRPLVGELPTVAGLAEARVPKLEG
jgi:6-phosphofructokinase